MRGDIDRIKERLSVVDVVSGYVKLEKAGASFKGRCPFHNEKTPSFFVSPEREGYYCFGCGAKGDIFTFVEAMEGLDFRQSLKMLADKAEVELSGRVGESREVKDEVYEVLELATEFFEKNLVSEKSALEYLRSRALKAETIKSWRLGFAPKEWRALFDHLKALGKSEELLLKAGLIKKKEGGGESYDVFRGRIIFPIFDPSGRVIAFSGRLLLDEENAPKYLNSPDTPLFNKSETLYGLDRAKQEIRKRNFSVLVEGQMDLLLSHQSGVANAVATSGTAFTREHLNKLKRLSPRIILAFDGDSAGLKAAEAGARLGLELGLEVKLAQVPEGSDPADLVKKSPEEWKNVLRQALPAVEFFLELLLKEEKDARKAGKLLLTRVLPLISLLESSIEQSHFVSLISQRTSLKEEVIWADLRKALIKRREERVSGASQVSPKPEVESEVEVKVNKSYVEKIEERLSDLKSWKNELKPGSEEWRFVESEEKELLDNLKGERLREELNQLLSALTLAERERDEAKLIKLSREIHRLHTEIHSLEESRRKL